MQICTLTQEMIYEAAPLFNAYRKFYGQPTNLKEAEQFLTARFNNKESTVFLAYVDNRQLGLYSFTLSFHQLR